MVQHNDSREAFVSRLNTALKAAGRDGRGKGAWLAKITNLKPKSSSKWLNAESRPEHDHLVIIAKALGVREEWLEYGKGPMREGDQGEPQGQYQVERANTPTDQDYAIIPQFSARAENGEGFLNDHIEVTGGLAFKREWLSRHHLAADQLSVIYARGDSMEPNIVEGDVMVIDHASTELKSGRVYLLRRPDGGLSVKRMLQRVTGEWVISSDNPNKIRYPDEPLDAASASQVPVIGEVVWRGGALN